MITYQILRNKNPMREKFSFHQESNLDKKRNPRKKEDAVNELLVDFAFPINCSKNIPHQIVFCVLLRLEMKAQTSPLSKSERYKDFPIYLAGDALVSLDFKAAC